MSHDVIWTQPPPIWPSLSAKYAPTRNTTLQQPAILRFATDTFMEEFLHVLAHAPQRLSELRARPETWRGFAPPRDLPKPLRGQGVLNHLRIVRKPSVGTDLVNSVPLVPASVTPAAATLKLYQPAHQRHYLVTSSLVCRVPGMPDRTVDSGKAERAGFVLRRLLPPTEAADPTNVAGWVEHAWVPGPRGAVWQRIASGQERALAEGEDLLPLFAVQCEERGRKHRRLFAGVVPTGKREAYLAGPRAAGTPTPGSTGRTSRKILLRKEVIEPWKTLITRAEEIHRRLTGTGDAAPSAAEAAELLKTEREGLQTLSWLILLDLARFLRTYAPPLWSAVIDPAQRSGLGWAQQAAWDVLEATAVGETLRTSYGDTFDRYPSDAYNADSLADTLRAALARFGTPGGDWNVDLEQAIELNAQPFAFDASAAPGSRPNFLFPLADPAFAADDELAPLPPAGNAEEVDGEEVTPVPPDADQALADLLGRLDHLAALLVRAMSDSGTSAPEPAIPTAAVAPADALRGWFVIRCIYDRPACLPLHGAVVSEATEPFEIAAYFDPDAPARPVRIGLPIDTTPAGLRKFDRNTAFVISDTLCGQMKRMKSITFADLVLSVLPWPFHKKLPGADGGPCRKGGLELGMICSLSIPIITLCALILLIIMVKLLDIIFRWMPFFILCFPIPGLKGKAAASSSSP